MLSKCILGEALTRCGREATIIQDSADFHPGWFSSQVHTIELKNGLGLVILIGSRFIVIPETLLMSLINVHPVCLKLYLIKMVLIVLVVADLRLLDPVMS